METPTFKVDIRNTPIEEVQCEMLKHFIYNTMANVDELFEDKNKTMPKSSVAVMLSTTAAPYIEMIKLMQPEFDRQIKYLEKVAEEFEGIRCGCPCNFCKKCEDK